MSLYRGGTFGRGQFAALLAIYHHPRSSGIEVAEHSGLGLRIVYAMVSRLRRRGLIRTSYVRDGSYTRAEHLVTARGHRMCEAWSYFLIAIGPKMAKEFRFTS